MGCRSTIGLEKGEREGVELRREGSEAGSSHRAREVERAGEGAARALLVCPRDRPARNFQITILLGY